jgi:hypothetical protein
MEIKEYFKKLWKYNLAIRLAGIKIPARRAGTNLRRTS